MLSESHSTVLKAVTGFSESLLSLQGETKGLRHLESELQGDAHTGITVILHQDSIATTQVYIIGAPVLVSNTINITVPALH